MRRFEAVVVLGGSAVLCVVVILGVKFIHDIAGRPQRRRIALILCGALFVAMTEIVFILVDSRNSQ